MNETGAPKLTDALKVVPPPRRQPRRVAKTVEVCLPPIRWTPDLINEVARVLAGALVQDLRDHPTGQAGSVG